MAQTDKDGTRGCLSAGELVEWQAAYKQYVADMSTSGEDPLSFDSWLNSKGRKRCGMMAG